MLGRQNESFISGANRNSFFFCGGKHAENAEEINSLTTLSDDSVFIVSISRNGSLIGKRTTENARARKKRCENFSQCRKKEPV